VRWQDRHSHLFGKLLLVEGLKQFGYDINSLSHLLYNKYDRPFLNENIDFNISHSDEFVICAIGQKVRIGIDIERIKEIDFSHFSRVMTNEQWDTINNSINPKQTFFNFWVIKESVIKANSRGLSIPLLDLYVNSNNTVNFDKMTWYLKELLIDKDYCSFLSSNIPIQNIKIIEIDYFENRKWL